MMDLGHPLRCYAVLWRFSPSNSYHHCIVIYINNNPNTINITVYWHEFAHPWDFAHP
jgi:hypothetical protein